MSIGSTSSTEDIKPANVMVVDGGLVKVLDFGIAILRGAGALPRLTQIDRTVGTPPYMSPEQCLGQAVTAESDVYSLGCLLCELLTGDPPYHGTADRSLRAHHLLSPVPSVRERRADVPAGIDALVAAMLAKEPHARPSAETGYDALVPMSTQASDAAGDDDRDPTRPFRRPLLSPPPRPARGGRGTPITEPEVAQLKANARVLLDNDQPAEAIRLLEDGVARAVHDPYIELRLRHFLAAALFYAGEYSRAASLFDVVGRDYARHLAPSDPLVLDSSYHAGHAYAEIGKPDKALPHLQFYLHHTDGETDEVLGTRFVVAQMFAAAGRRDDALAELQAVRPLLAGAFGPDSTQVRNLDRHLDRLTLPPLGEDEQGW